MIRARFIYISDLLFAPLHKPAVYDGIIRMVPPYPMLLLLLLMFDEQLQRLIFFTWMFLNEIGGKMRQPMENRTLSAAAAFAAPLGFLCHFSK